MGETEADVVRVHFNKEGKEVKKTRRTGQSLRKGGGKATGKAMGNHPIDKWHLAPAVVGEPQNNCRQHCRGKVGKKEVLRTDIHEKIANLGHITHRRTERLKEIVTRGRKEKIENTKQISEEVNTMTAVGKLGFLVRRGCTPSLVGHYQ